VLLLLISVGLYQYFYGIGNPDALDIVSVLTQVMPMQYFQKVFYHGFGIDPYYWLSAVYPVVFFIPKAALAYGMGKAVRKWQMPHRRTAYITALAVMLAALVMGAYARLDVNGILAGYEITAQARASIIQGGWIVATVNAVSGLVGVYLFGLGMRIGREKETKHG
jgi:hypothetical protein